MKYRIKLANKANGDEAEVIVPSHTPLEDLSVKIKLEMHLPYSDGGWHRFLVGGAAYMPEMHCVAEPEMLEESGVKTVRSYRPSESVSLADVFTVLQSAVTIRGLMTVLGLFRFHRTHVKYSNPMQGSIYSSNSGIFSNTCSTIGTMLL